jgi:DNA-binding transcriptional MerR regulator
MRISKVSELTSVSADTLRYYEKIGLIPTVTRSNNGIRDYQDIDIKRIEFIKCMRRAGLPVKALIEYIELVQQGNQTIELRKEILKTHREQFISKIKELQETLDLINYKIQVYEEAVLKREVDIIQVED